jgi:hypothetical protein
VRETRRTPVEVLGRLVHRLEHPERDIGHEPAALSRADGV